MKKFILLAGLAAMLAASPAFATVKHVAKPAAMCMVHGKKVLCHPRWCIVHGKKVLCHYSKKHHVMHKVVAKKKKY